MELSNLNMQVNERAHPEKYTREVPARVDNVIFHIIQLLQCFHGGAILCCQPLK